MEKDNPLFCYPQMINLIIFRTSEGLVFLLSIQSIRHSYKTGGVEIGWSYNNIASLILFWFYSSWKHVFQYADFTFNNVSFNANSERNKKIMIVMARGHKYQTAGHIFF